MCRDLPPWSAVRADTQTQGRGRLGRAFASARGGLWISAVLPANGPAARWEGFSLQAGLSLRNCLRSMGAAGVRLRWPNDLLIGEKKLAGLLIEQTVTGKLIVGFGMNVLNSPREQMPELAGVTTRLVDLITPPALEDIASTVLNAIASAHASMEERGMGPAIVELNHQLQEPQAVELLLTDGRTIRGFFTGLDAAGHLRLLNAEGREFLVEHPLVERLREHF